jgi:hypothetical protein
LLGFSEIPTGVFQTAVCVCVCVGGGRRANVGSCVQCPNFLTNRPCLHASAVWCQTTRTRIEGTRDPARGPKVEARVCQLPDRLRTGNDATNVISARSSWP